MVIGSSSPNAAQPGTHLELNRNVNLSRNVQLDCRGHDLLETLQESLICHDCFPSR